MTGFSSGASPKTIFFFFSLMSTHVWDSKQKKKNHTICNIHDIFKVKILITTFFQYSKAAVFILLCEAFYFDSHFDGDELQAA